MSTVYDSSGKAALRDITIKMTPLKHGPAGTRVNEGQPVPDLNASGFASCWDDTPRIDERAATRGASQRKVAMSTPV
jgi:hypothetical protein